MRNSIAIQPVLWTFTILLLFAFYTHKRTPSNGSTSPEFCRTNQNLNSICFPADSLFQGKMTLVEFRASWCGKCVQQQASIHQIIEDFKTTDFHNASGLEFLSISLDKDSLQWQNYVQDAPIGSHILDTKAWKGEMVDRFGISYLPYTFLVDGSGKIVSQGLFGPALRSKLEKLRKK